MTPETRFRQAHDDLEPIREPDHPNWELFRLGMSVSGLVIIILGFALLFTWMV